MAVASSWLRPALASILLTFGACSPQGVDFAGIDFDDDLDFASGTVLGLQRGFELHTKDSQSQLHKDGDTMKAEEALAEDPEANSLEESGDKKRAGSIVRSEHA
mmetsp:Transcript_21050/g.39553  ORF Transcript_21050/g.39553 Transcript_21050/m.39553 type:complete len:104 (+) Transcript_21050:78-389(+)